VAASPTAIVLAGGGVALGEAAHFGLLPSLALGLLAWAGRIGMAGITARHRRRPRLRPQAGIDPFSLGEPWRGLVRRAVAARQRYEQLCTTATPGPVTDHLVALAPRVTTAAEDVWNLARVAAATTGPEVTTRVSAARQQLLAVQERRQRQAPVPPGTDADERRLAGELQAARRDEQLQAEAHAEVVARTLKLEALVSTAGQIALGVPATVLIAGLDALAEELDALHAALGPPGA
jgi:hypothetical protein